MMIQLLLIAHIFGDFLFQTNGLATRKQARKRAFFLHVVLYTLCMAVFLLLSLPLTLALVLLPIISVSHLLIDLCKVRRVKNNPASDDVILFVVDQALHVIIILMAGFSVGYLDVSPSAWLKLAIDQWGSELIGRWVDILLVYLICMQPTAILIKKLLQKIFPAKSTPDNKLDQAILNKQENVGFMIGILERFIIITLGLAGQMSSIGFIIAAKSLARFNQLSEKEFAEKYLIGTLTSILIVVACSLLIIK